MMASTAWVGSGRAAGSRIVVVAQAVFAVEPFGVHVFAQQRMLRAGIDRHIGAAQFGGVQGIAGRLRHGDVARHDGDGAHLHVGRTQRHDQRYGVVGSGIGIDQKGSRHGISVSAMAATVIIKTVSRIPISPIVTAALWTAGCTSRPAPLRIAAAADLQFALGDVIKGFQQQHDNIRIEPVYGSSGLFYAQLVNHAPFDLYLSADMQYPRKLAEQGLIVPGSEFTYAVGRIVLWTGKASGIDVERLGIDALKQPAVHHVAIANPAHAPYGRAAEAALRSLGVYDAVKASW